ncbi:ABC transporter substrate-binding protein [soil metagenome]
MSFSRRETLALLTSTIALTACGASDSRPVLKVGSQRGSTKAVMLSSDALAGAPYRVEWSEFPAAQPLLEAIGSGVIDLGLAGDAPFLFAYQSGSPIQAVSAQMVLPRPHGAVSLIVPPKSPARSIADLKGKKVATTRGSIGHFLTLRALAEAHLPFDYVQFTWLSPGDTKAAFGSGSVDAWATWGPYVIGAMNDGAKVIADGYDLINGYAFEVANEQAIKTKGSLLTDFAAREAKALAWSLGHKSEYARVLAAETGLPLEITAVIADRYSRQSIPIDDRAIADQQVVLDIFRASGDIKVARPLDLAFHRIV